MDSPVKSKFLSSVDQEKKKTRVVLFVLTVFALCTVGTSAWALFGGKVDAFTADNVHIDSTGKIINSAKLYVTEDAVRIDGLPGAGMGKGPQINLSMLILKKQKKSYFYNHDKKLVFEAPADEKDYSAGYKALDNIESEKVLGKEKVSGYKCVKKEVVASFEAMGRSIKSKLIVWESDKFDMPLRTMDEDGAIEEMRNIKTGKPSKKLFRPMPGYKKVDSMMAVMGMDFGAMMAQKNAMDEKEEDAQTMSNPAAGGMKNSEKSQQAKQRNLENMDINKIMKQMGGNMSPEQKAQLMRTMNQVKNRIKDTNEGPGSADRIWQIIPRRPGDKVGAEFKTTNVLNVTMGTRTPLESVFKFYKNKLTAKGWKDGGMYLQDGQGSINLSKGEQRLSISSAKNPGIEGDYSYFYMMQLNGPDN
ncbi:DUF4412 domain-containing protein [uncultured Desulfobacter sp.]|uniref:DUF4412 domain-containing protein n=1 Tax=uncultured Desulfobacter sp. TaxID=240139 RepID=UPI002AAB110C|nr:DUF4412 domain-containing protein [uncultured Desulfobacter sp.]